MDIKAFIRRWRNCQGGAERSNATMYLLELTQALGLAPPDPAAADTAHNDYVFERAVRSPLRNVGPSSRIDLYKRGCFVLEAKQSRWMRDHAPIRSDTAGAAAPSWRAPSRGRLDVLMRNARAQAYTYVSLLPADHPAPPFLIVCDVARHFELWADFSGTGRGYAPFPDPACFHIPHEALADQTIQDRLRAIWTAPKSLNPARPVGQGSVIGMTTGPGLNLHHLNADGTRIPVRPLFQTTTIYPASGSFPAQLKFTPAALPLRLCTRPESSVTTGRTSACLPRRTPNHSRASVAGFTVIEGGRSLNQSCQPRTVTAISVG